MRRSVNSSLDQAGVGQGPDDLHDDDRLVDLIKSRPDLACQCRKYQVEWPDYLGTETVGDHAPSADGVQPIDEVLDLRRTILLQWIQAQFNGDIHFDPLF